MGYKRKMMLRVYKQKYVTLLTDINECGLSGQGGCQQFCINTQGSFTCDCGPGFALSPNGQNCLGKYHHLLLC